MCSLFITTFCLWFASHLAAFLWSSDRHFWVSYSCHMTPYPKKMSHTTTLHPHTPLKIIYLLPAAGWLSAREGALIIIIIEADEGRADENCCTHQGSTRVQWGQAWLAAYAKATWLGFGKYHGWVYTHPFATLTTCSKLLSTMWDKTETGRKHGNKQQTCFHSKSIYKW